MVNISATNAKPALRRPCRCRSGTRPSATGTERELTTYAEPWAADRNDPTRPVVPFTFPGRALA